LIVLDVETYRDYFLVAMKDTATGKLRTFERYDGQDFDARELGGIMSKYLTVGFNSFGYDLPIIASAMVGSTNAELKRLSDRIITSGKPSWMICKDEDIFIPKKWDHIDLIEVAPGQASLKIYGGRLGASKLQDLPIAPDASITPEQREQLRRYCENDLDTTALLLDALDKPLDLRVDMSEQYGMDLRSKSDAQIAETVIKSEMSKLTGKRYGKPEIATDRTFRYQDPGIIEFETPQLIETFDAIRAHDFTLSANGSVQLPKWLKDTKISIGSGVYRMGIGGLHSSEKRQYVEAGDGLLFDLDVASYYPSIILQQSLAPETMGEAFLTVYQSLVSRRLQAKAEGDTSTADTLKIAINGSFGKLGSKYSALYSPDLLIQTTITGQLALLMLIERVEKAGGHVVSANTDGIVVWCERDTERAIQEAAWDWELSTSYELERTDYARLASRDVNNYVAVKPDGSTKGKGAFASRGLMKNPDRNIVSTAVAEQVANGTPLEQTVKGCEDITQFVTVRTVKGGAEWEGEALGKAVRFYASREIPADTCIRYASNGNKVPNSDGCRPLMDLPETFPSDVDYDAYIEGAEKLLAEVGAC